MPKPTNTRLFAWLKASPLHAGIGCFVLYLGTLMLFYSGHIYSNDTVAKMESARSFLKHGTTAIDPQSKGWGLVGKDGKVYAHFPLGTVVVCIPPLVVAGFIKSIVHVPQAPYLETAFVALQGVVATALCGGILAMLLVAIGLSFGRALCASACIVFCSEILPYASSGWSEPYALLLAVVGCCSLIYSHKYIYVKRSILVWGICVGCVTLFRIELFVFCLFVWCGATIIHRKYWRTYLVAALIMSGIFCLNLWYNNCRYGNYFDFGYFGHTATVAEASAHATITDFSNRAIRSDYWMRLYWLLFSFGKLHFWYVSSLLLLVPVWFFTIKAVPKIVLVYALSALCMVPLLPLVGINSWAYANRYVYVIFPFVLLPLAFIVRAPCAVLVSIGSAALVGFITSVVGSLINYHVALERLVNRSDFSHVMCINLDIRTAPWWEHCRMLPGAFVSSFKLVFGMVPHVSREWVRTQCLDVWPSSVIGAGVNPVVAMGLYCILLVAVSAGWVTIIKLLKNPHTDKGLQ